MLFALEIPARSRWLKFRPLLRPFRTRIIHIPLLFALGKILAIRSSAVPSSEDRLEIQEDWEISKRKIQNWPLPFA